MSTVFIDGFDHYDTAFLAGKGWTPANTSDIVVNTTGGRDGNGAVVMTSNAASAIDLYRDVPAHAAYTMGFGLRTSSTPPTTDNPLLSFRDGASGFNRCGQRLQ